MCKSTENEKRLTVLISGSSLSANKGAMAMTVVLAVELRKRVAGCRLRLLSKYPEQDRVAAEKLGIELVCAKPGNVVTATLLRSVLAAVLKPLPVRWLYNETIRAYDEADILVDMGGVAFSDDQSLRGFLLSVGWIMPAIATSTPFVKLSQAIGPFRKPLNRICAKFLLKRAELIIARGKGTSGNLDNFFAGKKDHHLCADVAFLLEPESDTVVEDFLKKNNYPVSNFIGISPSAVVDRKAKAKGIQQDYRNTLKYLIEHIRTVVGKPVVMIPHAWPQGGKGKEDMDLCLDIYQELSDTKNIFVIKENCDAALLKGIIARSEAFIACRFHAMIAALSSTVPVQVIGWGHKYNEIMEMFDMQQYCCDFTSADSQEIALSFSDMWQKRQDLNGIIAANLQQVKLSSEQNFQLLEKLLRDKGLL